MPVLSIKRRLKSGVRRLLYALCLICDVLIGSRAFAGNPLGSYNLYPTAVEGSARYVALGGATVAYPDEYYSVFINPAGMGGMAESGVDFGSDSNNIDNFVVDLNNPKARALNDPIRFSFYGFRFVSDDGWGFGATKQTPFSLDSTFAGNTRVAQKGQCLVGGKLVNCTTVSNGQDITEIKTNDDVYTLAAGKAFFDKRMSVGLAMNYIQVSESYNFSPVFATTVPFQESALNDTFSMDFGALARPWPWLQIGGVYKMGYRVAFDDTRNANLPATAANSVHPFRDGKVPDRCEFGFAWRPDNRFTFYADSKYVFKLSDGVVVASGLFPGGGNIVSAGQYDTIEGHWGAEYVAINQSDLSLKLWAGGYLENTGIQGGFSRYHRTAGFGFNPWFLTLAMAVDDTNLYNNFTVGLGVDMLQVAGRIAKRYGWTLPL